MSPGAPGEQPRPDPPAPGVPVRRVVFTPSGLEARVPDGTSLLDAARAVGADLDSTCGGRGICGRCQVVPSFGDFAKLGMRSEESAVAGWTSTESAYRGRRPIAEGGRLGCAATVHGDLVVEIPEASQVHRQVVRKSVDIGDIEIDPVVKLHYIELPRAELGVDDGGLAEQILDALARDFDLRATTVEARLLPLLAGAARAGGRSLTVAVRGGERVVANTSAASVA